MYETANARHDQDFGKAVIEANTIVIHPSCCIRKRKSCINRFCWWTITTEKFRKVKATLLILWPIFRGKLETRKVSCNSNNGSKVPTSLWQANTMNGSPIKSQTAVLGVLSHIKCSQRKPELSKAILRHQGQGGLRVNVLKSVDSQALQHLQVKAFSHQHIFPGTNQSIPLYIQ